jgi:diguanylate cyclase (GGDEF)-like protein
MDTNQRLLGIQGLLTELHGDVESLGQSYSKIIELLGRLESSSQRDDLTGLLRRNAFFSKWETLLRECEQAGRECGVLLIDIDHFKRVNDTMGHATGDTVICAVAEVLQKYEAETPKALVARLGGEEFALVAEGTEAELLSLAQQIRRTVETLRGPAVKSDSQASLKEWRCTVSIGAASSAARRTRDAQELLHQADEALYVAKEGGRNRVSAA